MLELELPLDNQSCTEALDTVRHRLASSRASASVYPKATSLKFLARTFGSCLAHFYGFLVEFWFRLCFCHTYNLHLFPTIVNLSALQGAFVR